ncbi:hypothetical protein NOCA2140013 [metagenome]|uniref:Uncharacterized protein n=1 Tax=metagenome TaxID=256318 RepID=A0A2P2BWT3_9ZZZZ
MGYWGGCLGRWLGAARKGLPRSRNQLDPQDRRCLPARNNAVTGDASWSLISVGQI